MGSCPSAPNSHCSERRNMTDTKTSKTDESTSPRALADEHGGIWGAHPEFPVSDWQTEVENDDTRLGYWEWVSNEIEINE